MRLLHLGKYYPPYAGGMEQFLGDLLPAQQKEGVEPAALVHAAGKPERRTDPFPLWRVPTYGRLLYAPVSPAYPLWLERMIQDFNPDVLHLHLPNLSAFWALSLPRARRIPWVIHWHADVVSASIDTRLSVAYRLYRPFEQSLLKHSACIVTTSPPYRDSSEPLRPWLDKTEVVPLGLDPRRLPSPDEEDLVWAQQLWGKARFRLLCIGRLTYYKGHRFLLRAMEQVDEGRLICVGSGEMLPSLAKQAERCGEGVLFTGSMPDARRNALLATCDALVLPSVERTEAFGVVLLEAMAYGKPVIATRVKGAGMGWVVEHGVTGLLVEPGDVEAFVAALETMRQYPASVREQMGRSGREKLMREFHIQKCAHSLSKIYTALCT